MKILLLLGVYNLVLAGCFWLGILTEPVGLLDFLITGLVYIGGHFMFEGINKWSNRP